MKRIVYVTMMVIVMAFTLLGCAPKEKDIRKELLGIWTQESTNSQISARNVFRFTFYKDSLAYKNEGEFLGMPVVFEQEGTYSIDMENSKIIINLPNKDECTITELDFKYENKRLSLFTGYKEWHKQ